MQQFGTPDEVYAEPASPFVYHFPGDVNLFHGRVREGRAWIGTSRSIWSTSMALTMSPPRSMRVPARPMSIAIPKAVASKRWSVTVVVTLRPFDGVETAFLVAGVVARDPQQQVGGAGLLGLALLQGIVDGLDRAVPVRESPRGCQCSSSASSS